ncbi:MAG: class I SAM-dependent methyltransferase [Saprospiraceae bacterium]
MDRGYYKQYFSLERNHWWFVVRSSIIHQCLEQHLPRVKKLKILNIGVATGATSEMLGSFGQVISSEYDHDTCLFLKETLQIDVVEASVTDLPFKDGEFDVVCAFDVIEHVENDTLAVSEMKRVCKKEGTIAITVPADMSLWSQHDVINHHFRRYTIESIQKLMDDQKIKQLYSSHFNSILYFPIRLVRFVKNVCYKNEKPSSDFDINFRSWMNLILKKIFSIEKLWMGKRYVSKGVSIIWLGQRLKYE